MVHDWAILEPLLIVTMHVVDGTLFASSVMRWSVLRKFRVYSRMWIAWNRPGMASEECALLIPHVPSLLWPVSECVEWRASFAIPSIDQNNFAHSSSLVSSLSWALAIAREEKIANRKISIWKAAESLVWTENQSIKLHWANKKIGLGFLQSRRQGKRLRWGFGFDKAGEHDNPRKK